MRRDRRELWERICRLLFALYPPSFRRRCDSDRHRLLGDLLDAEPDRIGAARRARRVALDAAATLPRAWWTAGMDAARVGAVGRTRRWRASEGMRGSL